MNEIFHRTSIRKYLDKFLKIWTLSPLFHAAIRKRFMLNRIVLTSNLLFSHHINTNIQITVC